jgi:hypothetical protein
VHNVNIGRIEEADTSLPMHGIDGLYDIDDAELLRAFSVDEGDLQNERQRGQRYRRGSDGAQNGPNRGDVGTGNRSRLRGWHVRRCIGSEPGRILVRRCCRGWIGPATRRNAGISGTDGDGAVFAFGLHGKVLVEQYEVDIADARFEMRDASGILTRYAMNRLEINPRRIIFMKRLLALSIALVCVIGLSSACSRTRVATNFNGLSTPDGKPIAHLNTSNLAIHLFASAPIVGDATLEKTVADLTSAAKERNAGNIRIVQSKVTSWWFLIPPFTFVLTPVSSNVAADALP